MILIISEAKDPTARKVHRLVHEAGHPSRWIDFNQFPARDSIRYSLAPGRPPGKSFRWNGEWIDFDTVRSILWRRPSRVQAPTGLADAEVRDYVSTTLRETISGVFDGLDCLQVPSAPRVSYGAHLKIPQLTLAARLGFELPITLITNDPEEFLSFYRQHDGQLIVKPAGVYAESVLKGAMCGYARRIRPCELVHARSVQLCPFIAQVYVDKKVEIRVMVVGSDVFAVEIHSQSTRRTLVDWRNYDEAATPHHPHELPPEIADRCLRLVREMGLSYGAIDLILTPKGAYVFLEINPNGQYQWLEEKTGLPISERVARLLTEGK